MDWDVDQAQTSRLVAVMGRWGCFQAAMSWRADAELGVAPHDDMEISGPGPCCTVADGHEPTVIGWPRVDGMLSLSSGYVSRSRGKGSGRSRRARLDATAVAAVYSRY